MSPPKPVIDQRAAEQMNLNVLKRIDPQIEEVGASRMWSAAPPERTWEGAAAVAAPRPCAAARTAAARLPAWCHQAVNALVVPCLQLLATAGHVALYDFDIPTKRWVRCPRPPLQLHLPAWPAGTLSPASAARQTLARCLPASAEPQGCGGLPVPGEAPEPTPLPVHHPQQEERRWGLLGGEVLGVEVWVGWARVNCALMSR